MRRVLAFVVALAALLSLVSFGRPAQACENATLLDDPIVQKMQDAEEALAEGDVVRARVLAKEVAHRTAPVRGPMEKDMSSRATRLVAISWVRDRNATPAEIDGAVQDLRRDLAERTVPDPQRQADLGEAYARNGEDTKAYETLAPLYEKDLIGSPYAFAALARVAAKRGDNATAVSAARRCSEVTTNASICRGEYPAPPLLRGHVLGYAFPGVLAVFALVRRRRAKHPWAAHGDKVFAALLIATIGFVFAYARSPFVTTFGTLAALVVVGMAQRLAFVAKVKRERIAGFVLRDATAEDAALPAVASFFHRSARVLERVPDASYREPARVAVLRLTPRRRGALALTIAGVFVLALVGACTMATMRTTRSASVPLDSRLDFN